MTRLTIKYFDIYVNNKVKNLLELTEETLPTQFPLEIKKLILNICLLSKFQFSINQVLNYLLGYSKIPYLIIFISGFRDITQKKFIHEEKVT